MNSVYFDIFIETRKYISLTDVYVVCKTNEAAQKVSEFKQQLLA